MHSIEKHFPSIKNSFQKIYVFLSKKVDDIRFLWYNILGVIFTLKYPKRGKEMKSTGIVRKLDELGRIVLPMEMRNTLDISPKDPIEIFVENDQIILRKYEPRCIFCGSDSENVLLNNKRVCRSCIEKLNATK